MRKIEKGAEPACLAGLRREAKRVEDASEQPPAAGDWDPRDGAQEIRDALWRDQYGLCCYCMSRIKKTAYAEANPSGMTIEHFIARADEDRNGPRRMYDWANLLGVCAGCFRDPSGQAVLHCDSSRGMAVLHVDPTRRVPHDPETSFTYAWGGGVDGANDSANEDVETLNLGAKHLEWNRGNVVDGLRHRLRQSDATKRILELYKAATTPNSQGSLPPFALIGQRYLAGKLRGRGLTP